MFSFAQQTKTEDYDPPLQEDDYGGGAKKITTLTTEGLNKIITVEIKEAGGTVRRKIVWRKDMEGKWTKGDTCFKPSGKRLTALTTYFDRNFKFVREDFFKFNQNGSPRQITSIVKNENGAIDKIDHENGDKVMGDYKKNYNSTEAEAQRYITKIEQDFNAQDDPGLAPCEKDQSCAPKSSLSGGYSFLSAGAKPENISFALGAHVSYTHNLKGKLGLVADGSVHFKNKDDHKSRRIFLMAGVQYNITKVRDEEKLQTQFMLFPRLLVGLAADRQKYIYGMSSNTTQAKALAIAAGLGIAYPVNSVLYLQLNPDYIITRFGKETQSNFRVNVGVKIRLGCTDPV